MDLAVQFAESIVDALIQPLRTISPFLFGLLVDILIRKLMGAALIVLAIFALGFTSPSGIEGVLQGVAKLFQVSRQRKVFKDGKTFISGGGHVRGAASIVRRRNRQGPVPLGPMPYDLAPEAAVPLMKARARRKSPEGTVRHTELPEGTL